MSINFNDSLIECIKALGGSKVIGPMLWPDLDPFAAQRKLLDCTNEDRPQSLQPAQVLFIMRKAREIGCHAAMQFLCSELSYAEPIPIEPKDEADELRRQLLETMRDVQSKLARLEQVEQRPALRKVPA